MPQQQLQGNSHYWGHGFDSFCGLRRVMLINSPFTIIAELKFHHLYSLHHWNCVWTDKHFATIVYHDNYSSWREINISCVYRNASISLRETEICGNMMWLSPQLFQFLQFCQKCVYHSLTTCFNPCSISVGKYPKETKGKWVVDCHSSKCYFSLFGQSMCQQLAGVCLLLGLSLQFFYTALSQM